MKGIIKIFLILSCGVFLNYGCSTSPSINGYCEYLPVFHYVKSNLPEEQKDNIRKNNYLYDTECLGIDYNKPK